MYERKYVEQESSAPRVLIRVDETIRVHRRARCDGLGVKESLKTTRAVKSARSPSKCSFLCVALSPAYVYMKTLFSSFA